MSPEERAAFEGRISDLRDRLDKLSAQRQAGADGEHSAQISGSGMAYGMRMAGELVATVIVGGLIGIGLDKWLGTWPWLFVLLFVLGFAAGVLNVVRAYERIQKQVLAKTGGRIGHAVADDDD